VDDNVQQTSMLHLCCCLVPAAGIMVAALSGLYGTVAYFHSRLESIVGILIGTATLHAHGSVSFFKKDAIRTSCRMGCTNVKLILSCCVPLSFFRMQRW
jgi:hypothetical protein